MHQNCQGRDRSALKLAAERRSGGRHVRQLKFLFLVPVSLLATGLTFYLAVQASALLLEWIGGGSDGYAPLPSTLDCLFVSAPVETELEAACFAMDFLQSEIVESPYDYLYDATLTSGTWRVVLDPSEPYARDSGWVVSVSRNSGVTQAAPDRR